MFNKLFKPKCNFESLFTHPHVFQSFMTLFLQWSSKGDVSSQVWDNMRVSSQNSDRFVILGELPQQYALVVHQLYCVNVFLLPRVLVEHYFQIG